MGKNTILNNIRKNKGPLVSLPEIPSFTDNPFYTDKHFSENIKKAGGVTVSAKEMDLENLIEKYYPKARNIISTYGDYKSSLDINDYSDPHRLKNIELAIIEGSFGISENGAIWVEEEGIICRVLPFITENLIIVLKENKLVANMHEAYEKLKGKKNSFGVFIAGPSKTADIEQSLVIGAHGAKSLYVYLS